MHWHRPPAVFGRGLPSPLFSLPASSAARFLKYEAFDSRFDQDQLAEARKWHKTFQPSSLPPGSTSFSRASGPGGQHVNKTESKATTTWTVTELAAVLPRMLHADMLRTLGGCYYSKRSDCVSFRAQEHRSREANMDANRQKLFAALQDMYRRTVPGETSEDTRRKYETLKQAFREKRMTEKRHHSAKKAARRGKFDN